MEKENIIRNQKGFTLIEIIAVLVILGILAAVAVPKFVDLQEDARKKAALAVYATCNSISSMNFAEGALGASGHAPITTMALLVGHMDPSGAPEGWTAAAMTLTNDDDSTLIITTGSEVTGTSRAPITKAGF